MALIKCTECGKEISSLADFCPHCGCPSSQFVTEDYNEEQIAEETVSDLDIDEAVEMQDEKIEIETETVYKKSKAPFVLTTVCLMFVAIITVVFVILPYSDASKDYESGIILMESGDYRDAYYQFQGAMASVSSNYKDSNELSITCVQKLMDEKNYTDAFDCITNNENIAKKITVKKEDYAELGKFIDKRLISAFSKDRYEAYIDVKACYAIAANNVLPNEYGNVKAYINIGVYTATAYAEYDNNEDFFICISSMLCDLLKNNSNLDIVKRILEQDSLLKHFLSGETPDKRHEDFDGECISTWNDIKSSRQFFIHGIGNGGCTRIGSWKDFESSEYDEAEYYHIKNATYYCSFEDKSREAVPQYTFTINSYSNITIKSCTTNKKMTMTRTDYQSFWNN